MIYGKITKGLPSLKIPNIIKKAQDKEDEIKKVYEANTLWNGRQLQLHWHNLEWVNPRSEIKRKKPYSVSSFFKNITKSDIQT